LINLPVHAAGSCTIDATYESNDTEATAYPLTAGSYSAEICNSSASDPDIFVTSLDANEVLYFYHSTDNEGDEISVMIYECFIGSDGTCAPAGGSSTFLLFKTQEESVNAAIPASTSDRYLIIAFFDTDTSNTDDIPYSFGFGGAQADLYIENATMDENDVFSVDLGVKDADLELSGDDEMVIRYYVVEWASDGSLVSRTRAGVKKPQNISESFMKADADDRTFSIYMISTGNYAYTFNEGTSYTLVAKVVIKDTVNSTTAPNGTVLLTEEYDSDTSRASNVAILNFTR
jgi:hypothetical protein